MTPIQSRILEDMITSLAATSRWEITFRLIICSLCSFDTSLVEQYSRSHHAELEIGLRVLAFCTLKQWKIVQWCTYQLQSTSSASHSRNRSMYNTHFETCKLDVCRLLCAPALCIATECWSHLCWLFMYKKMNLFFLVKLITVKGPCSGAEEDMLKDAHSWTQRWLLQP